MIYLEAFNRTKNILLVDDKPIAFKIKKRISIGSMIETKIRGIDILKKGKEILID